MHLPLLLVDAMLATLMRDVANFRAPDEVIPTATGKPYLRRWHVTAKGQGPATYLHHFLASDEDRALHDHPWDSIGIILSGSYLEHIARPTLKWPGGPGSHYDPTPEVVVRHTGDVVHRDAHHTHRVELFEDVRGPLDCWTLFLVGHRRRDWGFACPDGGVPWQEFTAPGPNGLSRGCG
jgi:hypothetical protein